MTKPLKERLKMVEKEESETSIVRQCDLVGVCRSTLYYKPTGQESDLNLEIMQELDKQYMKTPFYGKRRMTTHLNMFGYSINIKRTSRLMHLMGLKALYPKPNTSLPDKEHEKYPYLLKDLNITHSNHVWATDITYVPMKKGFMYLMAIIDLYSRKVLHWSVSNTMEAEWCAEVLNQTISMYGTPEIFNTDQGSQFTSNIFTKTLKDNEIKISMDGKGRATDNIFVERLWRSVKYEDIYLKSYSNGLDLQKGLIDYFDFYNYSRPHSSLSNMTPAEVFEKQPNYQQLSYFINKEKRTKKEKEGLLQQ
ncbi:MAG: IS3 family transposase [Spirosomataceae bacterium]|jgi:putative transposase